MRYKLTVTLLAMVMMIAACGTDTGATPVVPAAATATPLAPQRTATSLPVATAQPTVVLPAAPTVTAGPLPAGDLSNDQMITILAYSLVAYPYELGFHATNLAVSQTITGTIQVESASRLEITIQEPLTDTVAIVDVIVITPTVYAKVTGLPGQDMLAAGLLEGQWSKIDPSQDPLGLANLGLAAAQPAYLLLGLGFQEMLTASTTDQTPFKLAGTEEVGGAQTNVYERQTTSDVGTTSYRVAVDPADSRIYEMQAQGPIQATVTMSYKPIDIQPPIP
jgi:hypothetical protein